MLKPIPSNNITLIVLDDILHESVMQTLFTSSPAVAEKLRVALLLSVVNFNSTIRRVQSSVISYFRFRFTAAYK